MNGQVIASVILGVVAVCFIVWALADRARVGHFSVGTRIRLRLALIFVAVIAWLSWLQHGAS